MSLTPRELVALIESSPSIDLDQPIWVGTQAGLREAEIAWVEAGGALHITDNVEDADE